MSDTGDILGLDFRKGEHQATAVTPAGKKAFDKRLPNTDPKLRELFAKLQAKHGTLLVVVDQPASIGALPLAVARVEVGDPPHRQAGQVGDRAAHVPGDGQRQGADRGRLVDHDQQGSVLGLEFREQLAELGIGVG